MIPPIRGRRTFRDPAPEIPPRRLRGGGSLQYRLGAVLRPRSAVAVPLRGDALSNTPQIFACLGMVVGLYGILYLEVARAPERGWLLAAVGLTGKILGPIGLAQLLWSGAWPPRAAILCVTNDFIWWIPFALYLHDAWPFWRREIRGLR